MQSHNGAAGPPSPSGSESSGLRVNPDHVLVLATVFAVAAFLMREIVDADTWWQVAIGRDILARFSIPSTDHFTAAAMGRAYHDSHWLFQVLVAIADRIGGMKGVWGVMILLWLGIFGFCYRAASRWIPAPFAALLLFTAAIACSDRFTPRPDLVTCLMIVIFYFRFQEGKYLSLRDLSIVGLLQVVWSNSHGLFVIGPFMAACYLVSAGVRRLGEGTGGVMPEIRLFVLLLVASVISPFGFGGWKYAFLLMEEAGSGAPELFKSLAELYPTFGPEARAFPDFWFFLVLVVVVVAALGTATYRRQLSIPRALILAALFVAATTGRRNMPLFALTAVPFAAEHIGHLPLRRLLPDILKMILAIALLATAWFPLSGRYYRMLEYPARFGVGATTSLFPHALPQFLRRVNFTGGMYNSNYLGGFCLYHGFRPLIDGRWETYDPNTLKKIFDAPFNAPVWESLVSEYAIEGALLMHSSPEAEPILPRLRNDPRWRLVYYDNAASFWMRLNLPNVPPPATVSTAALGAVQFHRIEDYLMVGSFLRGIGAYEEGIACLKKSLALQQETEKVLERLGRLQMDLGRNRDAEQTFLSVVRQNPEHTGALNELAFFAFSRGDMRGAEAYLRKALEVRPQDPEITANLKRIVESRNGAASR